MGSGENKIETPEGAVLRVNHNLLDASDPHNALALTVHIVGDDSVCNFWVNNQGSWGRLIPERVLIGFKPSVGMLSGELIRAALDPVISPLLGDDIRFRYGIIALDKHIERLDKT